MRVHITCMQLGGCISHTCNQEGIYYLHALVSLTSTCVTQLTDDCMDRLTRTRWQITLVSISECIDLYISLLWHIHLAMYSRSVVLFICIHLVNTIHSFSQDCLFFSFLSNFSLVFLPLQVVIILLLVRSLMQVLNTFYKKI